jgi:putative FmdB family regulatory protein
MPIFEYECQKCSHTFEKFQIIRQSAMSPTCPQCETADTRQLLSRFSSPSSEGASLACAPSALA